MRVPAAHPTLFSPFRGMGERGSGDGLGLGIYIANEIVRSPGGTLEVASSEATGATFRVKLPRRTSTNAIDGRLRLRENVLSQALLPPDGGAGLDE